MNEQPLTFGDVVDLHKQLKKQDPFFANMTTSQFAKYANQETGSDLYQAGENDSIAKKYSYYVNKAFSPVSEGFKHLGREGAALFTDNPRYQDIIGHMAEKTPRMMLEGALTFGTGPIGWAGKALGGLSMATDTYEATDNLGAAAVTGVSGALFPAFQQTGSRIGGKLAEKALTQEVTTSVSGQQVVNRLPYQNKMAEWGLWGAEKAGSVTGTVANMEVASRLTDSIMGQSTPEDEHLLSVLAGVVPFESAALASRLYKGVPKGQPASETHARLNDLYQGTRAAKRMAVAADTQEAFVNTAEMGVKQPFSPDKPFSPEQQAIIDHPHMEQVREEYRNVLYSMATDGKAITKEALTKEFNLVPKAADALLEKLQNLGHINPDGSLNEARLIRPKDIAQLIKQKKGEPLVPTPKATDPVAKEADKAVTKVLEKALETEANPELDEINAALEEAQLKNDSIKVSELQAKKDVVMGKALRQTFSEVVEQNGQKVEKIFAKVENGGAQQLMTGEGFDPVSKLPKELTPAIIKKWFRINPQTGVVEAVGKGPKSKDALQNYYPEIEAVLTGQVKPASSEMPPVEKGPQAIVFENAVKTESTTQLESRLDQLNFHLEQLKYGLRAEGVTSDMEIRWKTDWERQREFILTELKRRSPKFASAEMPVANYTPQELEALDLYTASSIGFNYKNPEGKMKERVEALNSMLQKASPLKEDTLYRAVNQNYFENQNLTVGSRITPPGFISTSKDKQYTLSPSYSHPSERVDVTIKGVRGLKGIDVDSILATLPNSAKDTRLGEREILLGGGVTFVVESYNGKKAVFRVVQEAKSASAEMPHLGADQNKIYTFDGPNADKNKANAERTLEKLNSTTPFEWVMTPLESSDLPPAFKGGKSPAPKVTSWMISKKSDQHIVSSSQEAVDVPQTMPKLLTEGEKPLPPKPEEQWTTQHTLSDSRYIQPGPGENTLNTIPVEQAKTPPQVRPENFNRNMFKEEGVLNSPENQQRVQMKQLGLTEERLQSADRNDVIAMSRVILERLQNAMKELTTSSGDWILHEPTEVTQTGVTKKVVMTQKRGETAHQSQKPLIDSLEEYERSLIQKDLETMSPEQAAGRALNRVLEKIRRSSELYVQKWDETVGKLYEQNPDIYSQAIEKLQFLEQDPNFAGARAQAWLKTAANFVNFMEVPTSLAKASGNRVFEEYSQVAAASVQWFKDTLYNPKDLPPKKQKQAEVWKARVAEEIPKQLNRLETEPGLRFEIIKKYQIRPKNSVASEDTRSMVSPEELTKMSNREPGRAFVEYSNQEIATLMAEVKVLESYIKTQVRGTYEREEGLAKSKRGQEKSMFQSLEELMEERNKEGEGYEGDGWTALREAIVHSSGFLHPDAAFELSHTTDASKKWASWVHRMEAKAQAHELEIVRKMLVEAKHPVPTEPDGVLKILEKQPDKTKKNIRAKAIKDTIVAEILKVDPETGEPDNKRMDVQRLNRFHRIYELYRQGTFGIVTENIPGRKNKEGYQVKPLPVNGFDLKTELLNPLWQRKDGTPLLEGHFMTNYVNPFIKMLSWKAKPDPMAEQFNAVMERNTKLRTAELVLHEYFLHAGLPDGEAKAMAESVLKTTAAFDLDQATFMKLHSGGKNFGQAWITPSQQFVGISLETLAKKMGASPQPVKKFMASWLVGHELSHLLEQNPESAAYRGAMKAIVGVEPEVRANLVEQMFRAVVPKEMQTAEFREQLEVRKAWARLDSTEALADFTSLMALGLSHAKTSKRFLDTVKFDTSIHMQDFMRGNYRNLKDLVNGLHHYTSNLLVDSPTRFAQAEFVKSTFEGLQAALRSSEEIKLIHSSWMKLREHSLDNYFENGARLNDLEHITEFGARVGPDGVAELTTKPASSIMPELKKLKSQFQDIIYGRSKRELEEYLGVQLGTGDRRLTPFNQFVAKYSHIQSVAEASDLLHGANVDSNTALVQIMAPLSTDGKKFNPDYFKKMVDNKQVINAVQKIIIAKQKAERSFTETEMRDTLRNAEITHPEVVKNAITLERIFDEIQGDGTTGLSAFIIRTRMKKSESLMANLIMLNDKNPMAGGTGQMNAKKATLIAEALMNHVRTGDPNALVGLPPMAPEVLQRLVDTAATMRKSEDFYRGQVSNRPWYRPLQRRGDYGVVVRQNGKVIEMRAFDSADKALAFTKEQEAKGLQVNFYDDQIRRSHLKRLDGETIAASAKMDQDVYEEAMVKVGLSPDDVQYMKDLYTPGLAYAKAKVKEGMGGNLSQRKMVAGYEQENLLRGYLDFITGTVHGQSRMLVKQQVDLVMLNPDMTKNPQVRDWLRDHSKTVLQPPTPEWVGIKSAVFLWTMAWNLSSMGVEQTQPLAITSSHLAKHGGEAGLAYKLIFKNQAKWWAKAFNDNWKPQGIYETALKRAQDAGVLDKGTLGELYNEEDAGLVQLRRLATDQNWLEKGRDILHNNFYKFANISKQFYSVSPRATNAIAFLAAFEMAVNHGVADINGKVSKLTPDAAYQFAVDTVRTTNYTGGTVNRPGFFHNAGQAHGAVGAMYSLGGYTLNSIAMMLRYAEKSFRGQTAAERLANQKAFAMQAAAQFVLAGAVGFPFAAAAITIIDETWPAVQLKKNLYQLPATLWQMVGGDEKMGGWISDLVMRGPITAFTPIDTASRTSLGNVLGINNRTGFSFTDAAGPAVSVLGGLLRATRAASLGQFGEALEQGSPAALRNIVNIVRDGGDFRDYKQRLIKHNDLSDPADATQALMAGIGFKDPMISQEAEKRRMVGAINQLEAKRWEGQLNELSDAMLQGKIEEVKLALLKKQAESGGTFNAVAGARSVIDKVLAKTYPSDPFGEGPNSTVAERQKLAMAFPQRQEQIPQLERLKKKTALEAMFRWPGLGTMSNTELTNAVMIDRLRAMNPLLTEDMAASMVRQQLHPLRVR